MVTQEEILEELRQVRGDQEYIIKATVIYIGTANWLGRTIEKSLKTSFVCIGKISTFYEIFPNKEEGNL